MIKKITNLFSSNKNFSILWVALISFLFVFVFSSNSPIFRLNNDITTIKYVQMATSWFSNFRFPNVSDLNFVSPFHIFVIGIGAVIKIHNTYIGLFLLSWVFYFITLLYFNKTIQLFLSSKNAALILTALASVVYFSTVSFNLPNTVVTKNLTLFENGLLTNEFCLPFISIIVYYALIVFTKFEFKFSNFDLVLIGISASWLVLEKFILIIPLVVLVIAICINLFNNKKHIIVFSHIVKIISTFALFILIFNVFIFATSSNHLLMLHFFKLSLKDIFGSSISFRDRLFLAISNGIWMIKTNITFVVTFFVCLLGIIYTKRIKLTVKVGLLSFTFLLFELSLMNNEILASSLLLMMPVMLVGLVSLVPSNNSHMFETQINFKLSVVTLLVLVFTLSSSWNSTSKLEFVKGQPITSVELLAQKIKSENIKGEDVVNISNKNLVIKTLLNDKSFNESDYVSKLSNSDLNNLYKRLSSNKKLLLFTSNNDKSKLVSSNSSNKKVVKKFTKLLKKYKVLFKVGKLQILKRYK